VLYEKLGRTAIRFAIAYLRRRYRRAIRIGIGIGALGLGAAAYVASRNLPEG
jgi:hypothetical protein